MSLTVVRAVGLVTIQDAGRPGHMHEGLAPGGALVSELLAQANRRVGNADAAAAIEVMGTLTVRADVTVVVATDAAPARTLPAGEELTVASDRLRVTYLAVAGGVDVPEVLGSRSTQLSAGLGRRSRKGDRLPVGPKPPSARTSEAVVERMPASFSVANGVTILPGPDIDAFAEDALATLIDASWTVSASSDRVGTRLDGPRLPRTDRPEVTRPMVRGAIEVPRDGHPIVLGPEHPTTGGYPVIAVVAADDIGRLFAVPIGERVRFRVGVRSLTW